MASLIITVLTAVALQLTHMIDFQQWVAGIVGRNLSVRFIDFGFRTALGALVVLLLLPWILGHVRNRAWIGGYLRQLRLTRGLIPGRTLAAGALSVGIMVTLLVGLAASVGALRGDVDFVLEDSRWFTLVLSLVPGIWEELAFRGLMLTTLQLRYRTWTAIVVSAALFGLFHITSLLLRDPGQVVFEIMMATAMGVVWGYLTVRTGSVLPAMISHYAVNVSIGLLLDPVLAETAGAVIFASLTLAYPLLTIALVWWLYRRMSARSWLDGPLLSVEDREPIVS